MPRIGHVVSDSSRRTTYFYLLLRFLSLTQIILSGCYIYAPTSLPCKCIAHTYLHYYRLNFHIDSVTVTLLSLDFELHSHNVPIPLGKVSSLHYWVDGCGVCNDESDNPDRRAAV